MSMSMWTWSNSARGTGASMRSRSRRSRVDTLHRPPLDRPTKRDDQKQGERDAYGIGGPIGKLLVSVDEAALGYLDQATGNQDAQGDRDRQVLQTTFPTWPPDHGEKDRKRIDEVGDGM